MVIIGFDGAGVQYGLEQPVATRTPVKREPSEPQGFIKPNGVGIPALQDGEEVKVGILGKVAG